MKLALVRVDKALEGYDAQLVHTVHDELVVEVAAEQVDKVKNIINQEMIRAGNYFLRNVPIEVDIKVGMYWGDNSYLDI